jgi:hypothetical protein
MALVLMQVELLSQWLEWSVGERSLRLLFWLVIGFMSYLVGLLVMGIRPAQLIKKPAVH